MSFKDRYIEKSKKLGGPYAIVKHGVERGTVQGIIRGSIPSADKAIAIARILEVDVEWLITGEEQTQGREEVLNEEDR